MSPDTQALALTKDFSAVSIAPHIEHDQNRTTVKLGQ